MGLLTLIHKPLFRAVLGLCLGVILILVSVVGLGNVLSELVWPSSRPILSLARRIGEQAPNLLAILALPGGYCLSRSAMSALRRR